MIDKKWICLSVLLLGLLGLVVPKAHAGVGVDRATGQAVWDAAVKGRTTNIGQGSGWKVIGPKSPTTAGQAGGSAKVSGEGVVPVGGKNVPVGITGEVAKDAIVGGVVGCATGGIAGCILGTATPLAIAYLSLSGARINPATGVAEIMPPWTCTTAPCYEYRPSTALPEAPEFVDWSKSRTTSCEAYGARYVAYYQSHGFPAQWTFRWTVSAANMCQGWRTQSPGGAEDLYTQSAFSQQVRTPDSPTWYPATPQELRDALYNNNPPPEIVDELGKHGNIVWTLGDPTRTTVSGPSSVSGPKEVTQHPDGSTTERQESTPLSYAPGTPTSGPTITAGNSTVTTTKKDPQGNTTSTETTTTSPGTEAEESTTKETEEAPTDTALPPVPDLYTRKYPDGIVGIWNQKKEQLRNTELVQLATGLMPNVGSGGTCPSWPVNFNLATTWAYGTHDVAPPCWIWDVAKAILIFSALLLARSLIFGG